MRNIPDIKVAIVVGSTDWLPSDLAIEVRQRLAEAYKDTYVEDDIYECSICITDNEVNIKRVLREINKAGCNALCLFFANYGPESAGTLLAQEFEGPVMMLAAAEEGEGPYARNRKDALSGVINACYSLKLRQTNAYIPSHPIGTKDQCIEMVHDFISIARILVGVKNLKLISIGPRPSSYLASSAPHYLLYDIGVEVSEYSELELLDSFNKHAGDKRIAKTVANMEQELDQNNFPEMLSKFAQYELTMEDWIRNHKGNRNYVALTSTCWPASPVNFGFTPCYVNSRFTGRGYPVACEVDVYGAVSEFIGQCVSGDVVTILNINNNIPQELYDGKIKGQEFNGRRYKITDLFLGYHCGVTASCKLISNKSEYHFVNHQLIGTEQSKGTIQGSIVPGTVTLFRIQGMRDNKLRAYVAQGQALPITMDTYGGQGIFAVPEMERFIRNVILEKQFPNHCVVIFGLYAEKLIGALKSLGIEEIDYNHPKEVPYASENVFSSISDWY